MEVCDYLSFITLKNSAPFLSTNSQILKIFIIKLTGVFGNNEKKVFAFKNTIFQHLLDEHRFT